MRRIPVQNIVDVSSLLAAFALLTAIVMSLFS